MKPRSMSALGGGSTLNGCLGKAGAPTQRQASAKLVYIPESLCVHACGYKASGSNHGRASFNSPSA